MTSQCPPLETMGRFATVVVDPPWDIQMGPVVPEKQWGLAASELPYEAMSLDEIGAMPIASILADDAFVFLWTTNRLIPGALSVLDRWGVAYWFTFVWAKNDGMQTPNNPRHVAEFVIVGRHGSPRWLTTKALRTIHAWPRTEHSAKPEGFYDLLRRVTPAPRLDIFNRRLIAGFTGWGYEAPTGEPPAEHYQEVLL